MNYSIENAWRMLRAYRDALRNGVVSPSAAKLAPQVGIAVATGVTLRRACIELGWLEVTEAPSGSSPGRVRLTPAGRIAAQSDRPPQHGNRPAGPVRRPPTSKPAPKPVAQPPTTLRPCLCCGRDFHSLGSHNRICIPCRSTETYRSGDVTFHAVRL